MLRFLPLLILMLTPVVRAGGAGADWGFFMHRKINRYAVFTLPPEMVVFYKAHLDLLMRMAVDPDRRRHLIPEEAPRHYIDLDHYDFPDSLAISWQEASGLLTEEVLMARGIVPWHINRLRRALTNAFRLGQGQAILKISADLGHYIADAHVPLHTTSNYDGQQSGQEGIHALWESRLPELFFGQYDVLAGRAVYLDDPLTAIWQEVFRAHRQVDSVLLLERRLHEHYGEDISGGFDFRANRVQRVYNHRFSRLYHRGLGGMVERQFLKSVRMTGSIWFTSWVDAGQPDLSALRNTSIPRPVWEARYDSLKRADSIRFSTDSHGRRE